MSTFVATTSLDHDPAEVFAWHERPGAFIRLTQPGSGRVESEASDGLAVGSRAVLRMAVPGTRLPGLPPAVLRWVARHTSYDPPRGFTDVMESGPFASWRHERDFATRRDGGEGGDGGGGGGGTTLTETVTYELPRAARVPGVVRLAEHEIRARLRSMFAYRGRVLAGDLAFHAAHPGPPRTVAITGASGLVGTQVEALLTGGGHRVRRLVRGRPDARRGEMAWDPMAGTIDRDALADVDVVINLAGHPIAGRFTDAHLRRVRDSRVRGTDTLARALADLSSDGRQRALVNGSASGYYGPDRGDEPLTEQAEPGDGALAEIVGAWEAATEPARAAGVRVALVRTGIVQSPAGGQLGLQLPLFTWGLGGPLGSGSSWLPWIGIDDIAGVFAHIALTDVDGPINACAPHPTSGQEYAATLGRVLHRPTALRVPTRAVALLLGEDGAREFALAGQRMVPKRLVDLGYAFRQATLQDCLEHVLATTDAGPTAVTFQQ